MRGYARGYADVTQYERSISLPVSTGLGRALGAIVRPVVLSRFIPQLGYESTTDWENAHTQPISTSLFGRPPRPGPLSGLGADTEFSTDEEMTQPNEAPRESGFWDFLKKGIEVVPTAAVKGVQAYKTYESAGGGTAGINQAVIDIFGKQTAASAAAVAAAQQKAAAAQAAAAAKPWYQSPVVLVGGGLLAAVGLYAATRR